MPGIYFLDSTREYHPISAVCGLHQPEIPIDKGRGTDRLCKIPMGFRTGWPPAAGTGRNRIMSV